MKISRSNYEIWFADRLDGKLDDLRMRELELFLEENPDLKEEFDEFAGMRIDPPELHFYGKKNLLKSPMDLPDNQFEYLCVASLENDLSSDQQHEFQELVSADLEKKKAFELISRMKLAPPAIKFQHKKKLLRRTRAGKVVRLSVAMLSAAAVIAMILLLQPLKTRSTDDLNSAGNSISAVVNKEEIPGTIVKSEEASGEEASVQQTTISRTVANGIVTNVTNSGADSITLRTVIHEIPVEKIYFNGKIEMSGEYSTGILAASPVIIPPATIQPVFNNDRSNVARFLARNFREKLMKEKTAGDSPLKSYEIAEAGISGLNRLLGWEMALTENTNERGQLKSVRFSSKLLKFNTQVKNSSYSR